MNLLKEQLKELEKLPQDLEQGYVKIEDVELLLYDFDNKWWASCQGEMNKLSMGLKTEEPITHY